MDWKILLSVLDKFIPWATPKKLFMLLLACVLTVTLFTIYQKRNDIVSLLTSSSSTRNNIAVPELHLALTNDIKSQIKNLVDRNPNIAYVGVVSANIRINQRELAYFYSDDPIITDQMTAGSWHMGSTQSIFTSSEINNEQMVAVINGEFGCFKYEDTINFIAASGLVTRLPYVCRVSLPPYYGEFAGYLAIGLREKPDENRQNDTRVEAVRLATEIYFKSIAKRR